MLFDGTNINIFVAFIGGLVAFLSPCVFPLIPAYVGYFGGVSITKTELDNSRQRRRVLIHSLLFAAGFIIIFVLLGIGAGGLSKLFLSHRILYMQIGGALMMIFGILLLDIFRLPWLYREAKINAGPKLTHFAKLNTFVIGLTFGFAWTPCIGPVLATILLLASQSGTAATGGIMLFFFGLGIAVPFVIISLLIGRLSGWLRRFARVTMIVQRLAGGVLVVIGLLMVTNKYHILTSWILRVTNFQIYL